MYQNRKRTRTMMLAATALIAGVAILGAACGGGTSSADKTSTAVAKGGASTPATTKAATTPTKAATTSTAAAGTTPAATGTAKSGTTSGASVNVGDTAIGKVLTDNKGMTLYTFKNDVAGSGKSTVPAAIAPNWPPLTASASGAETKGTGVTGDLGSAALDDGTKIVTYKGLPLYHFINDKVAGDTKGDKLAGIWFVAVP